MDKSSDATPSVLSWTFAGEEGPSHQDQYDELTDRFSKPSSVYWPLAWCVFNYTLLTVWWSCVYRMKNIVLPKTPWRTVPKTLVNLNDRKSLPPACWQPFSSVSQYVAYSFAGVLLFVHSFSFPLKSSRPIFIFQNVLFQSFLPNEPLALRLAPQFMGLSLPFHSDFLILPYHLLFQCSFSKPSSVNGNLVHYLSTSWMCCPSL